MLLLHSKMLCVYKHLVIAYYEKESFKKVTPRQSNIVAVSFLFCSLGLDSVVSLLG